MIIRASKRFGFANVRPNQHKAIKTFLEGHDVFVSLPTGGGKSLCYAVLPYAFDELRGRNSSIAIIVSPLNALMINQVRIGYMCLQRALTNAKRCRLLRSLQRGCQLRMLLERLEEIKRNSS